MKKLILFLCAFFGLMASSPNLYAQDASPVPTTHPTPMLFPTTGDLSFDFTLPQGWTSAEDADHNLLMFPEVKTCAFMLSSVKVAGIGSYSMDEFAGMILKAAGATPYTSKAPTTIDARAAQAYFSELTSNGIVMQVKLILVVVDNDHVGALTTIESNNMTPEITQQLHTMLDETKIRFRLANS